MKEGICRHVRHLKGYICTFGFLVLTMAIPGRLFAALGDNTASVQADQAHMQASLRTIPAEGHVVQELRSPTGVVVREYVSPDGTVVAVAWEGPWFPDMRQLLGSHFDEYARALQAQSAAHLGRRPIQIELPGLVVNVSGHPRSFAGRAYVPQMLPPGMKAEDIR
jgi:hypothetical protein